MLQNVFYKLLGVFTQSLSLWMQYQLIVGQASLLLRPCHVILVDFFIIEYGGVSENLRITKLV